jgi:hypothetical protein
MALHVHGDVLCLLCCLLLLLVDQRLAKQMCMPGRGTE